MFYVHLLKTCLADLNAKLMSIDRYDEAREPLTAERDAVELELDCVLNQMGCAKSAKS